jgi:hypothetical protein
MVPCERDEGANAVIVYATSGLSGIELWHGIARDAPLYQLRESKREYFEGLREFLVRLHTGDAVAEEERYTAALRRAAGFQRVVVTGGEAVHPLLGPTLCSSALPFAVRICPGGMFAGRNGAHLIFEEMEWRHGIALDLGQLHLKVMTAGGECAIARDPELLPFGVNLIDEGTAIARLRDMLREGLGRAGELMSAPADGVVLALPVELDTAGIARPATYPGLRGAVEPIFSSLFGVPWVVLNDAVLTARGHEPKDGAKTLVVTLGFGVGGALWEK